MSKEKGKPGAPGKKGDVNELLLIMLQGVDVRQVQLMFNNLEKGVFSGEQYQKVHKRYKVVDIATVLHVHSLLKGLLKDGETEITSNSESEVGEGQVASFSGGSGAIEDLDKSRRISL